MLPCGEGLGIFIQKKNSGKIFKIENNAIFSLFYVKKDGSKREAGG